MGGSCASWQGRHIWFGLLVRLPHNLTSNYRIVNSQHTTNTNTASNRSCDSPAVSTGTQSQVCVSSCTGVLWGLSLHVQAHTHTLVVVTSTAAEIIGEVGRSRSVSVRQGLCPSHVHCTFERKSSMPLLRRAAAQCHRHTAQQRAHVVVCATAGMPA